MAAELIEVPVGGDRFRAHVLLEAVRAAGIEAELMTGDDSGVDPFLGMVQGHRLLIAAVDQYRVQAVLERVRQPPFSPPARSLYCGCTPVVTLWRW